MKRSLALVAILAACTAKPGGPDATPADAAPYVGPSAALFEIARGGGHPSEFYALPFPNDLRVLADGTLDLSDHVKPNVLLTRYLDLMAAEFHGFSPNQAAFFRFSEPIDPTSLPDVA